jgi:anti-sigma factor RsiW
MSKSPLNEKEQADLVAYLDGELTGEAARAMERKISLEPAYRAEADALKRTWDLLDYLPRSEPSVSFTQQTMSKLAPVVHKGDILQPLSRRSWRWAGWAAGWAALLLLSSVAGYQVYQRSASRGLGEKDLVRDLRLIENMRFYDVVDDLEFLRELDQPDLFGADSN